MPWTNDRVFMQRPKRQWRATMWTDPIDGKQLTVDIADDIYSIVRLHLGHRAWR